MKPQHQEGMDILLITAKHLTFSSLSMKRKSVVEEVGSPWQAVTVYGVSHSPWVQGVVLALCHHDIPVRLTSYPFGFRWFWNRGLVFPALRLNDGTTLVDSFKIYESLEQYGYHLGIENIPVAERNKAQFDLENMFSNYSLGRSVDGKNWLFFKAWSLMEEHPNTVHGSIFRAFLAYYFWILIRFVIFLSKRNKRPFFDIEKTTKQLARWNQRLSKEKWLTGENVGFLDFALLGHLQCMSSGLTDELLPVIKSQPHIIRWIEDILPTINSGVTPLYTRRIIQPNLVFNQPKKLSILLFWVAWVACLLLFPFTISIVVLGLRNRFKNPAHSGAVLNRYRRKNDD